MKSFIKLQLKPLWILFSSRWGGPEQIAIMDMADLAREGVNVTLICLENSPIHAAALRNPQIQVIPLKHKINRFDLVFINFLRGKIKEWGTNIIHIKDEKLLWSVVPALVGHPEISVIGIRHAPVENKIKKWMRAPLLGRFDFITVLSETVRQSVIKNTPVRDKKVKVINLGLDFSRFDPQKVPAQNMREKWGVDNDTVVIGSVGRIDQALGHDTFIKAAAGLLKFKDRKIKFVFVGEEPLVNTDEYMDELKALMGLFHIDEKNVLFTYLGDNLPEVMAAFDIYVMPGREEVPGLGALEALAMEKPVVLSRIAGSRDIVGINQEFGLLVRTEDAFDLQQKIIMLLDNPSLRMNMGVNGRKFVLRHFDKNIRFIRTLEMYEKCLRRRFFVNQSQTYDAD